MSQIEVIPLFPLPVAVVPGEILPLHVFEERYRAMVADCRNREEAGADGSFGVLLVHENRMFTIGCTAQIRQTEREYEDGRMDLVTVGQRRFRVVQLINDKPYLSAAVEYFDDDNDRVDPGLRHRVLARFTDLAERAGVAATLDWLEDEPHMSYRLAAAIVSEQVPKQHLLELTDENARLDFLEQFIEAVLLGLGEAGAKQRPLGPVDSQLHLGDQ